MLVILLVDGRAPNFDPHPHEPRFDVFQPKSLSRLLEIFRDTLEVDMPHCDLTTIHSIEGNHGSFQNFENGQYFQPRKFNDLISFAIVA